MALEAATASIREKRPLADQAEGAEQDHLPLGELKNSQKLRIFPWHPYSRAVLLKDA
jgi:hypothetical protein